MLRIILFWLAWLMAINSVHSSTCPNPKRFLPCSCTIDQDDRLHVDCDASNSDGKEIRSALHLLQDHRSNITININHINDTFTTVPEYFVPPEYWTIGSYDTDVNFWCQHLPTTEAPVLSFASNSMHAGMGKCSITSFFTHGCNIRKLDASIFRGCNKLLKIGFEAGNVESYMHAPELDNLIELNIINSAEWQGSDGLQAIDLTAAKVNNLHKLSLHGGQLTNDHVSFMLHLKRLETVSIVNNALFYVPDLSTLTTLHYFEIEIDGQVVTKVSVSLPSNRDSGSFNFVLKGSGTNSNFSLAELKGFFDSNTVIELHLQLDTMAESVFTPALQKGAIVALDSGFPFDCQCDLSSLSWHAQSLANFGAGSTKQALNCPGCNFHWLVNQPELLKQVHNGVCKGGRRFEDLDADIFSLCTCLIALL